MVEFPYVLTPAARLSPSHLTSLLNRAYEDYDIPVQLDEAQFAWMCQCEDVDLGRSVVAWAENWPVGITLLSVRGSGGWVSGVGVLPRWRRRGVAGQMLRYIQALAAREGFQSLWLEVLEQNVAGLALYRRAGFTQERELLVLVRKAGAFPPAPLPSGVAEESPDALLHAYAAFHPERLSWQRQLPSLAQRAARLAGLEFREDERRVGYMLYQCQRQGCTIFDLAIDPVHPQPLRAARTLLLALSRARADLGSTMLNLPADDPLLPVFLDLRYNIWHRQQEMVWWISGFNRMDQRKGEKASPRMGG